MSVLQRQVKVLDQMDAADLLGDVLNHVHRLSGQGARDEAERQLGWWMRAVGNDAETLSEQVARARSHARYAAARLEFAAGQQHRRAALHNLHGAVAAADWAGYLRWRWAGRAYADAVRSFAREQRALDQLERGAPAVEAASSSEHVRQRRVLRALYMAAGDVSASSRRDTQVRLHAHERAGELFALVSAHEAERARLLKARSDLMEHFGSFAPEAARQAALTSKTLIGQIAELRRAARRLEHTADMEAITRTVQDGLDALSNALGKARNDAAPLSTLLSELNSLPHRDPCHDASEPRPPGHPPGRTELPDG